MDNPDLGLLITTCLDDEAIHIRCSTESVKKNFPPRIFSVDIKILGEKLGGIFPCKDSSLKEKKITDDVVLLTFSLITSLGRCQPRIHWGSTF